MHTATDHTTRWITRSASVIAVAAAITVAGCTGGSGDSTSRSAASRTGPEPSAARRGPYVAGWADVGPALVGAEVRLVGADGRRIGGTDATDAGGFFALRDVRAPEGAVVEVTGGRAAGKAFDGTLRAFVDHGDDGPAGPTTVTVATTLVVARAAAAHVSPKQARAEVARMLGVSDVYDLGLDVALSDALVDQTVLTAAAPANGGFDRMVADLAAGDPASPPPTVAAARQAAADLAVQPTGGPAVPAGRIAAPRLAPGGRSAGIGDMVAKFVVSKASDMVMRELGFDEQYNQFVSLTNQINQVLQAVNDLNNRFDRMADQMKANEYLKALRDYNLTYFAGIDAGAHALATVARLGGERELARKKGVGVKEAQDDLDIAEDAFSKLCSKRYLEAPGALADNYRSPDSLLGRHLDAVTLPQRYLTRADSVELSEFFNTYYAYQLLALRLATECHIQTNKAASADAAVRYYWTSTDSIYHTAGRTRTDLAKLPGIVPQQLPDGVVLDVSSNLLWLNSPAVGTNPKGPYNDGTRIPMTRTTAGPNGAWTFELAKGAEIRGGLVNLGAQMPLARVNRFAREGRGPNYPSTVHPYLVEIGLDKVAAAAPATGLLGFLWTDDVGGPVLECSDNPYPYPIPMPVPGPFPAGCMVSMKEVGRTLGGLSTNNAVMRWYPQPCHPGVCDSYLQEAPVSVCASTCNVTRAEVGYWKATGLYRAKPLPADRFTRFDVSKLG